MSWLKTHPRLWGGIGLALLALALLGPWYFDVIHVPAEYECQAPFVRLDGDFCGQPSQMVVFIGSMIASYGQFISGLAAGADNASFPGLVEILYSLLLVLLFLPLWFAISLILQEQTRRGQVFRLVVLILTGGFSLLIALNSHPHLFWHVWGVWLYLILVVGGLVLEASQFRAVRHAG